MKIDNGNPDIKADMRRAFTAGLSSDARILECFGGFGVMYDLVWSRFRNGVMFDKKEAAVQHAAERRPSWACYCGDAVRLLGSSLHEGTAFDVVDLDCYGSPWPALRALLFSDRVFAPTTTVFLTDGYMSRAAVGPPCRALWGAGVPRMNISRQMYEERVAVMVGEWTSHAGLRVTQHERWWQGKGTAYMAMVLCTRAGQATGRL